MKLVELLEGTRCWKGYEKKGTKKMFGKRVPNCVKKESIDESVEDEAWELLGQQEPNIQQFVKTLGLSNDQQSVNKLVPAIKNSQTITINPNQIPTLKNLANKGPADVQALRNILKIKGTPEAPQQFANIMQQRDQAEGRARGYDVGQLINAINTGNYEPPVLLKLNLGTFVIGGRTRLYAALALNKPIKVKVIDPNNFEISNEHVEEDLRAWFGKGKKGGAGGGGWDRYNTKGERIGKCGDRKPGEGKPKCLSKARAASLRAKGGKKAIAQAVNRKRRKDSNANRRGKAKNVSNKYKK